MEGQNIVENVVGDAAVRISEGINAKCIVLIQRKSQEIMDEESHFYMDIKIAIFRKIKDKVYSKEEYDTKIKKPESGTIAPIKNILMGAINKRYINRGERIVCIQDESLGTGYKSMLMIFDIDDIFFNISTHKLAENFNSDIIESVVEIALEIGREGREGKKVGTAFVVGKRDDILKHTKQLIINPFFGYPEESRKITDPRIRETVKELAQLDGVFIIEDDGTILSAGTYLNIDEVYLADIPQGLGTRHRSCAAITKKTNAIAVLVSESGGKVKIFKNGKIVMGL